MTWPQTTANTPPSVQYPLAFEGFSSPSLSSQLYSSPYLWLCSSNLDSLLLLAFSSICRAAIKTTRGKFESNRNQVQPHSDGKQCQGQSNWNPNSKMNENINCLIFHHCNKIMFYTACPGWIQTGMVWYCVCQEKNSDILPTDDIFA